MNSKFIKKLSYIKVIMSKIEIYEVGVDDVVELELYDSSEFDISSPTLFVKYRNETIHFVHDIAALDYILAPDYSI